MKITVIAPVTLDRDTPASVNEFAPMARSDNEVEVVFLEDGPLSIESQYDEAAAAPGVVRCTATAESQGADAVIISCMLDPGLAAARERVKIPVLGPAQVSMHVASMLCHKFSIVTVLERLKPIFMDRAKVYGVTDQLASVRAIDLPVLELEHNQEQAIDPLVEEAVRAIEDDGAEIILFGCTGMTGLAEAVAIQLQAQEYDVPVIDPGILTLKMAELLVDLGLSQSKLSFPYPPEKSILGLV